MKKLFLIPAAAILYIHVFPGNKVLTNSTGTPPGNTGGLGETTCLQGGCHSGNSFNNYTGVKFLVNGQDTVSTYKSGTSYPFTLQLVPAIGPKFGFQIMAVDSSGNSVGTITPTGTTEQIVTGNGRTYLTHTQPARSANWNFTWLAPSAGTGKVTFYAAIYAGNNQASSKIYLNHHSFSELMPQAVKNNIALSSVKIFPNPVSQKINIQFELLHAAQINVSLQSLSGQSVFSLNKGAWQAGEHKLEQVIPSDIANGTYMLNVELGQELKTWPVTIAR